MKSAADNGHLVMWRNFRRKVMKHIIMMYFILLTFWILIFAFQMGYFNDKQVLNRHTRSVTDTKRSLKLKAAHLRAAVRTLQETLIQHQKVKLKSREGHAHVKVNGTSVDGNSTKDECTRFLEDSKAPHIFITDVLRPFNTKDETTLSLMTHIDVTKLPRLLQLVDHWPGPMSVSVLGPIDHIKKFTEEVINSTIMQRHNIVLHFMVKTNEFYNWNLMRRMAKNGTSTDYIFMVDVDLLPSKSAFSTIKEHLTSPLYKKDMALIVPAFEFMSPELVTDHPANKSELLKLWHSRNILPFHDHWKPGYGPTDYETWKDETSAFEVKYRQMFEPYVVFNKHLAPDFDVSFILRDKVSFLYHLNCVGFRFFVLPDIFVVHYPHGKDQQEHRRMLNACAVNTYVNFVERLGDCANEKINITNSTEK